MDREEEEPEPAEPLLPVHTEDCRRWVEMAMQALTQVSNLKSDIRDLATSAVSGVLQAQTGPQELGSGQTVWFCAACFRRGWQLRKAILPNLLFLYPWRSCARICLVLFRSEESDADIQWVWQYARPAIQCGPLLVAHTDLPQGWHASVAKNTSHKLAIEEHRRKQGSPADAPQFLINLDCDNITGPSFMDGLKTLLPTVPVQGCIHAVGKDPGTTGRVGLWATQFIRIGGYDEDMLPMGYQDVDLLRRCNRLCSTKPCYMKGADVGLSVPNHLTDKKAARGFEKVRNMRPDLANMTWAI